MIPYGKQDINQQDIDAVVAVLKSDWLTQGPIIPQFEQGIAQYCQVQHAIATNSATSSLHIACMALGVTTGDRVWTSPISFVASSNCALYCDATVDFVDIDTSTGNMSVAALTEKLADAKQTNTLPKVVIPVHLGGQSCDMKAINTLAEQYGFSIIEDASHAIGARFEEKPVGACQYSDITVFSFHPVKIITSAEGGIATTNNPELARKMQRLRSHGVTNLPDEMTEPSHGPWYYQQIELGYNYRMTELQAALGLSQLARLDEFVTTRNSLVSEYLTAIDPLPVSALVQSEHIYSSYHLFVVLLDEEHADKQKSLICALREAGITAHLHYIPIHLQPYYGKLGFQKGDFPNAENYYRRAITLPLHPNMNSTDIEFICHTFNDLL